MATTEEPLPTYTDSPRLHQSSTSLSSTNSSGIAHALARFEYEAEKTAVQDATKVLLIEWEEEHSHSSQSPPKHTPGDWTVEWKGPSNKREGISLKAQSPPQTTTHGEAHSHRLYFLLQPGAPVPPSVSISFTPSIARDAVPTIHSSIPTLPAIFPPSLLTSGTSLGKKGVLHTLWAKSRLAALRQEIGEEEEQGRFEGVGIEMARDELEWIKEHFGVGEKGHGSASEEPKSPRREWDELGDDIRGRPTSPRGKSSLTPPVHSPTGLTSPTTGPSGSERLQQKMRGLRVGTSPSATKQQTPTPPTSASSPAAKPAQAMHQPAQVPPGVFTPPQTNSSNMAGRNPLSPEVGDVAVGSRSLFAALKGSHPSEQAHAPSHSQSQTYAPAELQQAPKLSEPTTKKPIAVAPPTTHTSIPSSFSGMASLDSFTNAGRATSIVKDDADEEAGEGLFAVAMSPRTEGMEASPFSQAIGGR